MITTDQFYKRCSCRAVGECSHNNHAEIVALNAMINKFASAMKSKLKNKFLRDGYSGWDNIGPNSPPYISDLQHHVEKGDLVDVANIAAILWNRKQP